MLLAIDTSTRFVGVALYNGFQVLTEQVWSSHDYHTVELAPAVKQALARCSLKMSDLSALGVAIGPGSFTGLRIGMALAKGISLARHLPLIGVPTLDVLASAQPVMDLPLIAALRAGRGRLAVRQYRAVSDAWAAAGEVELLTAQALSAGISQPTLVCGEFTAEERQLLARKRVNVALASPAQSVRRPSYLAELAWRRWQSGEADDPATLSPFYLHYHASNANHGA
ncbi:MAG TPA: tRNA (adenosine(37)-N6)-threonylcarbamoyltransferase complex dimerization subunit type 1 TsaB [Anaerolineales bacterium]|nr:tRNA (adenosine(37)-N6)-threonylcarbamoyltransferase complex dimerization subunit type 1 TsaB [Anaerolineales bacterium]